MKLVMVSGFKVVPETPDNLDLCFYNLADFKVMVGLGSSAYLSSVDSDLGIVHSKCLSGITNLCNTRWRRGKTHEYTYKQAVKRLL